METNNFPQYQCHKVVGAAKIRNVSWPMENIGMTKFDFEGDGIDSRLVATAELDRKPKAQIGDYFVEYDNRYFSFSPAKSFEEGYTLITKEPQ